MSLEKKVTVNTHYTRSVNIERDSASEEVVGAYIPTSRAIRTLGKVANTFHENQAPRAWSLVGPYGSGKSSFSIFLSELLGQSESGSSKTASRVLSKTNKELNKKFSNEITGSSGYLQVLITGAPESLSKRIAKGFAEAVDNYWRDRRGKKPSFIDGFKELAESEESIGSTELLDLVKSLQVHLEKNKTPGILLIIDELGKFLEYEARHYGANDIFLLQTLAEHACQGSNTNLLMFVLLHQSFEQYAKGLGESLKNEWAKIQGRFEEVPFLESVEQTLRVVSSALVQNFSKEERVASSKEIDKYIQNLDAMNALPGALNKKEANELFLGCYPLHPVSAILLPYLCQKVAQNERTLFSYLGSREDHGLLDMLQKFQSISEYICPHHIYDYFINNQPAAGGDYLTHRRWAEVVTAIERLSDAKQEEIELLKTIGILNIIGDKAGFKASREILISTLSSKSKFQSLSKSLTEKSVITYRRFNSEYRVWQGSDFDLEQALHKELANVGNFSLADELNKTDSLLPIVARRYTIESGALRYFEPRFIDARNYKDEKRQGREPRILFYLSEGQDDEKAFEKEAANHFSMLDLVVLCLSGNQLREAVAETQALKRVEINRQELNSDPVAKRELEDRLTAAEQKQAGLLQSLINSPAVNKWFHEGKNRNVGTKRNLQKLMSEVLKSAFHKAPVIRNELINRDIPSAQANAGRNKLLLAMLRSESEEDLGIDKFPPEKSMYRSVLKATGIHIQQDNGDWTFVKPVSDRRKQTKLVKESNILPAWQKIDEFLGSTATQAKSFDDLREVLTAPPYGLKAGILPILYIAAYSVYHNELALYENRLFKAGFTEEMLQRFAKRPDEFTFQRFRLDGLKASIFEQYGKVPQLTGRGQKTTLLSLAKPLVKFMSTLPDYTKKTRTGLSSEARQVMMAFELAKSPHKLILKDIPEALGFQTLKKKTSEKQLAAFSEKLISIFREFGSAYNNLWNEQRTLLAQAFNIDPGLPLSDIREIISGKCYGLENYTVDTEGVRAFILKLTKKASSDEEWFENILMSLGQKPSKKWLDTDQSVADAKLRKFSRKIIDLEQLSLHEKKHGKGDGSLDVYVLRSLKAGGNFLDETVAVDEKTAESISGVKTEISNVLNRLSDKELKLATIAELVDEFLTDYRQAQTGTKRKKKETVEQANLKSTLVEK